MDSSHEYLLEVFDEDHIPFPYSEEDYAEFDRRDTYNLDDTFACWLYERLRYFQDNACIDLTYHTFDIDGVVLNQEQCIQRMIDDCKVIMTCDIMDDHELMEDAKNDLLNVFNKVYWAMWW